MALSIEAALARRSSDVRTAGEGAAADDHAAGLWMERSTCGPVAMVRPCWLSLLPDDLLLPILSFLIAPRGGDTPSGPDGGVRP